MLGGVVAPATRWREDEYWGIAAEHVEETEWAQVHIACSVDRAGKRYRSWYDGTLKECVSFLYGEVFWIDCHDGALCTNLPDKKFILKCEFKGFDQGDYIFMPMSKKELIPDESVISKIYLIRGHKVMLDMDLAELYGVLTKNLKKAVRRNLNRFPEDFMFELSMEEVEEVNKFRFQIGTEKTVRFGPRYIPMAFTEQGVSIWNLKF